MAELNPAFKPLFIIGSTKLRQEWRIEGDLLRVRAPDGFLSRPEKLKVALRCVLENFSFPWLFKCDHDTWINPWRFNGYPFWRWDQVGNFAWGKDQHAGGAGFSLSRRAVLSVVAGLDVIEGRDEIEVGRLVREMEYARRFHEPEIWQGDHGGAEAGLLARSFVDAEAMRAFHLRVMNELQGAAYREEVEFPAVQAATLFPSGKLFDEA